MHMPFKTTALVLAALTVLGTTASAGAAAKPRLDMRGASVGSHVVDGAGTAHLTGTVTGRPFGTKAYTATLTADDGSLPEPGVCEPATATLEVGGPRKTYLDLSATGDVCGQWADATYVVTHRFTGRYVVDWSSRRKLIGTDGWIGEILATEGRANVEFIDT